MARPFILHASAEISPLAKVGGLADVVGSLPTALRPLGLRADIIIPWYGFLTRTVKTQTVARLTVRFGDTTEQATLVSTRYGGGRLYGIKHRFFAGNEVYQAAEHQGVVNDIERFTFFSRAVVSCLESGALKPDLIHCHDWHTGLIPTFLDYSAIHYQLPFIPTVFTIHNIAHQGQTSRQGPDGKRLPMMSEPAVMEDSLDDDQINIMKIAILSADRLTTVSPSYAREILTSEESAGLAPFLQRRRKHLSGILNGLDYRLFNPQRDNLISQPYSIRTVRAGKKKNRSVVLKRFGLPENKSLLCGMVTRLVEQKGLDLVLRAWPQLAKENIQLILLGLGDPVYEKALDKLAATYPNQVSLIKNFDLKLAQHVYAGSDAFLMPSRFEPCGLGQMIAMRYGTLPIVRRTGGLRDSVKDKYSGFVFDRYEPGALASALGQAVRLYRRPSSWYTMVKRDMKLDFSWDQSARKYYQLYQQLL